VNTFLTVKVTATTWMRLRSSNTVRRIGGCRMGQLTARRAALDSQAAHRREGQERDRRIDALAVDMLVAIGERDAAQRRARDCCRP
jgi:hypothetical protein